MRYFVSPSLCLFCHPVGFFLLCGNKKCSLVGLHFSI